MSASCRRNEARRFASVSTVRNCRRFRATISATGTNWTVTFADTVQTPSQALSAIRNIADPALANVTVPMPGAGMLHRFTDPDAGDTLFVVTATPPARGFIKRQDFVELSLLESIHGVAIRPNSDDVTADVGPDKVILGKPGGLTLSPADSGAERAPTAVRPIFDLGEWRKNREGNFNERADALIEAAGNASTGNLEQRTSAQARSRPLLHGARDVSGSRRRAQSGAVRLPRPARKTRPS